MLGYLFCFIQKRIALIMVVYLEFNGAIHQSGALPSIYVWSGWHCLHILVPRARYAAGCVCVSVCVCLCVQGSACSAQRVKLLCVHMYRRSHEMQRYAGCRTLRQGGGNEIKARSTPSRCSC
jgi:hypothetical protein